MKRIIVIMLTALSVTAFVACNGNQTKTVTTTTVADTIINKQPLAKDEIYSCKMHQDVMSEHPGKCSKCGMKLIIQKMTPEQQKMMKEETYTKVKESEYDN